MSNEKQVEGWLSYSDVTAGVEAALTLALMPGKVLNVRQKCIFFDHTY
ncbi:hypothetical protein ACLK2H_05485 [Escherichia coli]